MEAGRREACSHPSWTWMALTPRPNSTLPCHMWIGCAVGIGRANALAPSSGLAVAAHRGQEGRQGVDATC